MKHAVSQPKCSLIGASEGNFQAVKCSARLTCSAIGSTSASHAFEGDV